MEKFDYKKFIEANKQYLLIGVMVVFGIILASGLFASPTKNIEEKQDESVDFTIKTDSINTNEIGVFPDQKIVDTENPFNVKEEEASIEVLQSKIQELDQLGKNNVEAEQKKPNEQAHSTQREKRETYFNPYADESLWSMEKKSNQNLGIQRSSSTQDTYIEQYSQQEEEKEEEGEIIGWTAPELKAENQTYSSAEPLKETSSGLFKAQIAGTRNKNNIVTPENNRVRIRTIEPFTIKGYTIPKNTYLIAYASFSNELVLRITDIKIEQGRNVVKCNIEVLDYNGQPSLEAIGGIGASIENDTREDIGDEIGQNETVQNVPGGQSVIKSIFRKKVKAQINSDIVYLKIN